MIGGKMKSTSGNMILMGSLAAFSRAQARRRARTSVACDFSTRPIGDAQGVGLEEGQHERPDHVDVDPVAQLLQRLPPGQAQLHLLEGEAQLVGHGRLEVLAHDAQGRLEPAPGLHRDGQHVDDVGEILEDGVGPGLIFRFSRAAGSMRPIAGQQQERPRAGDRRAGGAAGARTSRPEATARPSWVARSGPARRLPCQPGLGQLAVDLGDVVRRQQPLEPAGHRPADHPAIRRQEGLGHARLS